MYVPLFVLTINDYVNRFCPRIQQTSIIELTSIDNGQLN